MNPNLRNGNHIKNFAINKTSKRFLKTNKNICIIYKKLIFLSNIFLISFYSLMNPRLLYLSTSTSGIILILIKPELIFHEPF